MHQKKNTDTDLPLLKNIMRLALITSGKNIMIDKHRCTLQEVIHPDTPWSLPAVSWQGISKRRKLPEADGILQHDKGTDYFLATSLYCVFGDSLFLTIVCVGMYRRGRIPLPKSSSWSFTWLPQRKVNSDMESVGFEVGFFVSNLSWSRIGVFEETSLSMRTSGGQCQHQAAKYLGEFFASQYQHITLHTHAMFQLHLRMTMIDTFLPPWNTIHSTPTCHFRCWSPW